MIYKKVLLLVFIILSVIFLSASVVCEYIPVGVIKIKFLSGHRDFIVSILTGLLGSTVLSSFITWLEIRLDRDRIMTKLLNNLYALKRELFLLEKNVFADIKAKYSFSVEITNKVLLLDQIKEKCNEILEDAENTYLSRKHIRQDMLIPLLHSLEQWSNSFGIRGRVVLDDTPKMEIFLSEFDKYLKSEENKQVKVKLETIIQELEEKLKIYSR